MQTLKTAQEKRLWSYISHWRQANIDYQEKKQTIIRGMCVRLTMQWLRVSFKRWRLRHNQETDGEQRHEIGRLQGDQRSLQDQVITLNNTNREKNDELSQKRQRHLNQCINAFETRLISIAVGRWRD